MNRISESYISIVFSKIHRYTPTESTKAYEKPVNRKPHIKFHPKQALDKLKEGTQPAELDREARTELLQEYLNVSQKTRSNRLYSVLIT